MSKAHPLLLLFGCLLLTCLLAQAQSGRRQAPPPAAPPVPTPTPEPPKVVHTPPPPQRVLVTNYAPLAVNLSTIDSDIVMGTFLQRLRASDALKLETANSMSRDAARKRAKSEEEGRLVIWLQLQASGMDSVSLQRPYPEDLLIQYAIFEPGTGAIRTSGNVYLRTIRTTLPGGRNGCYPNRYGLEGSLIVGALETAERVFAALSIPAPPLCQ